MTPNQDPVTALQDRKVWFSIYPDGLRVRCCIGFDTVRDCFGPLEDAEMSKAVVDNMHIVEQAATRAWRGTPLGEEVFVKAIDF